MDLEMDQTNGYCVEVSGWDASETFFVENTLFDWDGEEKKEISLRSNLREGCVIFVRLLQPFADGNGFPIAYQAVKAVGRDANGRTRVRLVQLRPRTPYKETAGRLTDVAVSVA